MPKFPHWIWIRNPLTFNKTYLSVSLILFVSNPIDRIKDGEMTNIRSSKCSMQSSLWQVGFHCTLFVFRSQSRKRVLLWWTNAHFIHWQIHLHNHKRHNRLFYTFNNDNIEFVIQVKLSHGECLTYVCQRWRQDSRFKLWDICPCQMLAKQILKPL